ncbi:GNAT family N-acetyltransferase [Lentilactobacillus kribbianus]|uniref:GNAT family N-acetyltransferase n=1 Tax=Lentilactobacillus kribbianus TaxID=2729622 RepID=UPI0015552441|nr:N-acetyltransferase [Lentilactobacillus kribbianus]
MQINIQNTDVSSQLIKGLLLMADPDQTQVKKYIRQADLYEITVGLDQLGVLAFVAVDTQTIELKNVAVLPDYRNRGLASYAINEMMQRYHQKGYTKMVVGTANSSITNFSFYQKLGFRFAAIRPNFFANYRQPIYENGIRAHDLIMFERII